MRHSATQHDAIDRTRYLSAESGVACLLETHPPLHFTGTSGEQWRQWRRNFRRHLVRALGPAPPRVPLDVEIVERTRMDGYVREKILFNPDPFSTVSAWVLIPEEANRDRPCPAVLCAHGHGDGKDPLVGLVDDYQHQVAVELTRAGFVTMAPDWRTFGERRDRDEWLQQSMRDGCNVVHMAFGYFGYHLLHLNICDGLRCLDVLETRPEVDHRRIGCLGCSFGGTMTTFLAALDRRIKAAAIICYLSTLTDALNERSRVNTCGSQFLFGLRAFGDIPDVAGLIAPRPCLVQIGSDDQCFMEADAKAAFGHLERIYTAAGAQGNLELDCFEGVHEISVPRILAFCREQLGRG